MDCHSRHDRIVRLLEARLEALAQASERPSHPQVSFDVHVLQVVEATRNAIALELLTVDEASAIWAEVRTRHPSAGWCRLDTGLAA